MVQTKVGSSYLCLRRLLFILGICKIIPRVQFLNATRSSMSSGMKATPSTLFWYRLLIWYPGSRFYYDLETSSVYTISYISSCFLGMLQLVTMVIRTVVEGTYRSISLDVL